MKTLVLFLLTAFTTCLSQTFKGDIIGKVVDVRTQEPIPLVNILVREKERVGGASDLEGNFSIRGLEVGTYTLQASAIGYQTKVVTNVVITTGRATQVLVKLEETAIELQGLTVQASYFSRAQQLSPISSNIVDRSEILRSPGGVQDVQRVVQNLPGVASSTDNINELIVRGGASYENLTIMDHMEIPSINHYSNQFNSAGPINMVNADMIEDARFSSGGFSAQYGDKSSSVLDLSVREGDRTRGLSSKTGFNMAGIGTLVEGGFAESRGSYILSGRNSLLEVLDKIVGMSSISMTAIPRYWDLQAKVVYDLSSTQKLLFNVLYGDSRISFAGDPKEQDELRKNVIDSSSVESLSPVTKQFAVGTSLKSLWGKSGYSVLTLYANGTKNDIDVWENFTRRVRGPEGEVLAHSMLNRRKVFHNHSDESFVAAKFEAFSQFFPQHELSFGGQVQTALGWENDIYVAPDTSRFDLNRDSIFEIGSVPVPSWVFKQKMSFGDASKYFLFISDKFQPLPRLSLTLGLRYDHFTYSGHGSLAPRARVSYQLIPPTTLLTAAFGRYYQIQPLPYYSDRQNIGYNKRLDDMWADHYVLGIEHIFDRGLKFSIEGYYKSYKKTVVGEDFVYSAIDTFWSDRNLTIGERYSYGMEIFLEQKQVEDFFGTLSVSFSRSRMKDPRVPQRVDYFPSDYDYPVIITALGGKTVKGVRDWLDRAPFFVKYPSYLLPLSNEMEISFKYRYQAGRPYTPREYVLWKQDREGGVKWSRGSWIDSKDVNSARYTDYSRLDLQWISRFYLRTWNINVYIAMMNVFNTKNVFYESHRSDGTKETTYQFSFFPVGGVEVEF